VSATKFPDTTLTAIILANKTECRQRVGPTFATCWQQTKMSVIWVVEPTDTNPDIASQDMQTTLFLDQVQVPPKLLGECRIIMYLFASAVKITVSISSTNCHSLVALVSFKFKILLKAFKFQFPALLLAWLTNQLYQVVCVAIVIYSFRIYSLI
jgi:hypothetical protein